MAKMKKATPAPEATAAPAEPEVPISERPLPYRGKINVALAVIHKGMTPGRTDQPLRPIATLPRVEAVTVI